MPPPKKQFSRPSVELGHTGDRKSWRHVAAEEIRPDDIVPGLGKVHEVTVAGGRAAIKAGEEGKVTEYSVGSPVWAFH